MSALMEACAASAAAAPLDSSAIEIWSLVNCVKVTLLPWAVLTTRLLSTWRGVRRGAQAHPQTICMYGR